jgi:hypothetical protein
MPPSPPLSALPRRNPPPLNPALESMRYQGNGMSANLADRNEYGSVFVPRLKRWMKVPYHGRHSLNRAEYLARANALPYTVEYLRKLKQVHTSKINPLCAWRLPLNLSEKHRVGFLNALDAAAVPATFEYIVEAMRLDADGCGLQRLGRPKAVNKTVIAAIRELLDELGIE